MNPQTDVGNNLARVLRTLALRYPEATEGVACEGASLESRTVKVRRKAFLFLSLSEARLKLQDSLAEAAELGAEAPGRCTVGAHGWVKVSLSDGETLPLDVLRRWIDESYRLFAPRQLVESLSEGPPPSTDETGTTGKPASKGKRPRPVKRPSRRKKAT